MPREYSHPPRSDRFLAPGATRVTVTLKTAVIDALRPALDWYIAHEHEGVLYLFGSTDGVNTDIKALYAPRARTSWGSFKVAGPAMAEMIRAATDARMQVVGQLHTHPSVAYHSDGDFLGAQIRYPGYVSIVLPEYGNHLPQLQGMHAVVFDPDRKWRRLSPSAIVITTEMAGEY